MSITVPNLWQIEDDENEAPGVWMLVPEREDVICEMEVGNGKNVTGTSATGFLTTFDLGKRGIRATRDVVTTLQDVQGYEAAYLAWTQEEENIRYREVYIPYRGYVAYVRYAEDLSPDRFSRQPVPCIRTFEELLESGLQLP